MPRRRRNYPRRRPYAPRHRRLDPGAGLIYALCLVLLGAGLGLGILIAHLFGLRGQQAIAAGAIGLAVVCCLIIGFEPTPPHVPRPEEYAGRPIAEVRAEQDQNDLRWCDRMAAKVPASPSIDSVCAAKRAEILAKRAP